MKRPSIAELKRSMTLRDYLFWRQIYFPKYGLACNNMTLTWHSASESDTPDTDMMIALAAATGRPLTEEQIERARRIERGQIDKQHGPEGQREPDEACRLDQGTS